MNKLDSIWYHQGAPGSNELASSHIALSFCALVRADMIVKDLLEMEFDNVRNTLDDESISPLEYMIAYTDGELYDAFVKQQYRDLVSKLFDSNEIFDVLESLAGLEREDKYVDSAYSLKCTWKNVDILADWFKKTVV